MQDDCSDHTVSEDVYIDDSFWGAPATPDNATDVSYSITLKVDVLLTNFTEKYTVVGVTLRNSNCGTHNFW